MDILIWPSVVLIIAIFFLLVYKKDISGLLSRVSGFKISSFNATTKQDLANKPLDSSSSDELMKMFDSKFLLEREKYIKDDLNNRGITEDKESIKVLIRHLAGTQVQLIFERIYAMIYGSQIIILQHLNTKSNGDTKETILPIYSSATQQYVEEYKNYPFDEYMGFLTNYSLVEKKNDRFFITHIGRDFLTFIAQTGKPIFKAY